MVENTAVRLEEFLKLENLEDYLKGLEFEDGVKLLEELCNQIESGDLPLSMAVTSYERGAQVLEVLNRQLSEAEAKIKVVQPTAGKASKGVVEETDI